MTVALDIAVKLGALRPIDAHFAHQMVAISRDTRPEILWATALVSQRVGEGDVCLDLHRGANFPLFQLEGLAGHLIPPSPAAWQRMLADSPLVGAPGARTPLILDSGGRLYLERYWQFEQRLATAIKARIGAWSEGVDRERLADGLNRLFPRQDAAIDWQKVAAALAVLRPFCVISGGPGTGKTRTVAAILALLVEQHCNSGLNDSPRQALRIALSAPTGKAAARLTQSIRETTTQLEIDPDIADAIPDTALTLHRLLGFRPGRCEPRYGAAERLPLDVLVVDEASMVDLPLMARLLAALPIHARLILLGDRDQLASVEAGTVLSDLCGRGASGGYSAALCSALEQTAKLHIPPADTALPAIADHWVVLQRNYRWEPTDHPVGDTRAIGILAQAVNRGDAAAALRVLEDPNHRDVERLSVPAEQLPALLEERVLPIYQTLFQGGDPSTALEVLNRLRILCAVREGPFGVNTLNRLVEAALVRAGFIPPGTTMYAGRPLMITTNDHAQRLYNGDIGVLLADPNAHHALRAFFAAPEGGIRRVLPARLPPHETVYAMTVHKSQGSEFADILIVLPEANSRVLTRELIYTGITRARRRVTLVAQPQRLTHAIGQVVARSSGLFDRLWRDATILGENPPVTT
jgi:exodeoxyribonuclease V alpha subunit